MKKQANPIGWREWATGPLSIHARKQTLGVGISVLFLVAWIVVVGTASADATAGVAGAASDVGAASEVGAAAAVRTAGALGSAGAYGTVGAVDAAGAGGDPGAALGPVAGPRNPSRTQGNLVPQPADSSNLMAVVGEVLEEDGVTPWSGGGTVTVENRRTHQQLSSMIGALEPGRYAVVFLDTQNNAAAAGDTLAFALAGETLVEPSARVMEAADVAAQILRFDLRVLRRGACCNLDLGTCVLRTEAACGEEAYAHSYQGIGTTCEPNPCPAPTFVLQDDGSGTFPSIQAALDAAVTGTTILLGPGVYGGPANRELDFHGKAVSVRSLEGEPTRCTIDCEGSVAEPHRAFRFHSGESALSRVEGIRIRNGYAPEGGGGVFCDGSTLPSSPTITGCVFQEDVADPASGTGGAILATGGSAPTISECGFTACSAAFGGAIYAHTCTLSVSSCTFHGNEGQVAGSGIFSADSEVSLDHCLLTFAPQGEAVACDGAGSVTLSCSDVYGNYAGDWIGGIAGQEVLRDNMSADPLFCDATLRRFTLYSHSPCAAGQQPVCGLLGAWPVECEATPADSMIVTFGRNNWGQCTVPMPNGKFISLSGGGAHSLGLRADGTVAAWGHNGSGQCNVPAPNSDFYMLAAGGSHSVGLKATGVIQAWGDNTSGQCTVPAPNAGFMAVAAGAAHSLGLKGCERRSETPPLRR